MRVVCALLLALCAISQGALAELSDLVQLVPGQAAAHPFRQLLQTADGSYGYGYGYGGYGYGYGGYGGSGISETLQSGSRRSLMQSGGGYGYGGYGYGGYGYGGYGGYGRRLAEIDFSLQPRDELLVYADQQQMEKEKVQDSTGGLSAAAAAALNQAHNSHQTGLSVPAGQCYCRYDVDYNIWALAEDICKQALYERCKTEAGLPCGWLDKFYAPAAGPAHSLPHEMDIASFLHEDCSPQPPCACAGLRFDASDSVPMAVGCCRDLKAACKTPFSGLCCKKVAAFCSDDQPQPLLAAWTAHNLHHADCSSYDGVPFKFVPYRNMTAAAVKRQQQQHQEDSAEEKLLQQAMGMTIGTQQNAAATAAAQKIYGLSPRTVVIVAAGAVCVAVVAVLFAMMRHHDDHSHTFEGDDDDQDQQESDNHTNNANLNGLLPMVSSGGGRGPRSVSVSMSGGGNSVREPLLQSHSSAPINRNSTAGTGRFSAPGDYMPAAASHGNREVS